MGGTHEAFISATVVLAGTLLAGVAAAAPVEPTLQTFGDVNASGQVTEFGGDGISGDATAFSTFADGKGNSLLLGLTITPR